MLQLVLHVTLIENLDLEEFDHVSLHVVPETAQLWKKSIKEEELPGANGVYEIPLSTLETTVWVEATEPSKTLGDIQLDLEFLGAKDTVRATATWGDLDIDSDNDDGLDARPIWTPTDAEDAIEDDPDKPGKFIVVNDGDADNDGIPEFADADHEGFFYHFTPLVLELPESLDWDHATIRFDYSGSDYRNVRTGGGTPENPYVYRPAPGHLRLWKLDESGNYYYIEPTVAYTASAFGFGPDNHIANLFVEGVRESASIGDQRITVEIDSNSADGEPGAIGDAVRVTVVRADLDVDSDNNNGFNDDWGRTAYDYEDHIEDIQADENRPGKLIAANMGDVDNGKIPNFADGITKFDHTDTNAGGNFVPLILELPEPLDVTKARIRFTYSESDPDEMQKAGRGTVEYPDVYIPTPGHLRIWTADGAVVRDVADVNAEGHFVKSGAIYRGFRHPSLSFTSFFK